MASRPSPLTFLLLLFAGWVNRQQQAVIDYLFEEDRVLRAVNGSRRLRLTDDQRRRLAVNGKIISADSGQVRCRERLGGMLKFYYRAAA
jgi:hypothetical protein